MPCPEHEVGSTMSNLGAVVWLTGLSGAGKSTIAARLAAELSERGIPVELLDGDEVRTHVSAGLGFSRAERDANVRRIGWIAATLAKHGVVAITAAISPYRATRAEARALSDAKAPGAFLEVFVDAPLEVCEQRDVKGLYAKARAGKISAFTGVSDPYEPPERPDVHLRTDRQTTEESVAAVLNALGRPPLARYACSP
jgi:adenylylsulfate kinase